VEVDPQFGIHRLVKNRNGVSSHTLRQEFKILKSRLPRLWTNRYFVSTVGGAPKSMLDAAFGETVRQWKYKSLWNNRHALQADRFFPSTRLCSECGHKNDNLSLSDREWTCPGCETHHFRDFNAALNLRAEGLKQLVASGYVETLNDCGQDVSLATASSLG
jgi:hypothetical protein